MRYFYQNTQLPCIPDSRILVLIIVLAEDNTPRLRYILSELLERRMGVAFRITTDAAEFASKKNETRINYTPVPHAGSIHIIPHGLLSQTYIRATVPVTTSHPEWHTMLWPSEGDVPFDLLAASFFLLSRYEEYIIPERDMHGRFEAHRSIAFRNGFLQTPIVDLWVDRLKKVLQERYPSLLFRQHAFCCMSTIDVDFAYLYKGLGWKRWSGKLLKSLTRFEVSAVGEQLAVTLGIRKDPYDTYDLLNETTKCNLAYFILMNDSGGHDKASKPSTIRQLIRKLKPHAQFIGIHPSYASNIRRELLERETRRLEVFTEETVTHSRQHFLKLSVNDTYPLLLQAGIQHDYTMMYAEQAGFRAGTCFPFFYYDLHHEKTTTLTVHSTCAMDVTLQNYMGLTADEAVKLLQQLRESTFQYQGHFITLWHNNTLSAQHNSEAWRNVYFSIYSTKTTEQN